MEKTLTKLLDYQRFEQNYRLAKLIEETANRNAGELRDEELDLVNAAGESDWLAMRENSGSTETWYGFENPKQDFEPGSRFQVNWQSHDPQK